MDIVGRAEAHEDHGFHAAIPAAGPPRADRTAATTGCPEESNWREIGLFRVPVDTDNENRTNVAFPGR